jgi:serine/threonine protein kinase
LRRAAFFVLTYPPDHDAWGNDQTSFAQGSERRRASDLLALSRWIVYATMEPEALKKINKYNVLEIIGRGGMGVVYKAVDSSLDRLVAIKMVTRVTDDADSLLKRFYREAQFTGNLRHPNIVTVYDLGDLDGVPYLVMEYLDGSSLESMLGSTPMTLLQKVNYVRQVCNGLEYAHSRSPSIVHRDIKPANIVVLQDGSVKIIDFGIARLGHSHFTRSGQLLGSCHYMSPEQIEDHELDGRSDVFSTGVLLYQLLTLRLPFDGSGVAQILNKIVRSPAPPLGQLLQAYPAELDAIVAQALAKDRDQRYQSAGEFAFELLGVEEQLKREVFGGHLTRAERLLHEGDFVNARQELLAVLKVDHQQTQANDLMRQVQQGIARQQRKERARDLRAHAEAALQKNATQEALNSIEQALKLDSTNAELQEFYERVVQIHARSQKLAEVLSRAERAYALQDFKGASQTLDEALQIDPDETRAKSFKEKVEAKLAECERDSKVEELLAQARRQILLRKFTGALELLRSAANLNPDAPGLSDLIALAEPAHELELRRRTVDKAIVEINEALDRPDPTVALELAEAALAKLPEERSLLKLKDIAEQQIASQRRDAWIQEQITASRNLLDSGKSAEALDVLETAAQKYPDRDVLHSFISMVRAAIQREETERRRAEYMAKAKQALRQKNYCEAISTLEAACSEMQSSEFDDLLQFASEQAAQFELQKQVDAAAARAQALMDSGEYEQAVTFLETTVQDMPDHDLRILEASARRQLADFRKALDALLDAARHLLAEGRATDAVDILEAQCATYDRETRFHETLEEARRQHEKVEAMNKAAAAIHNAIAARDFDAAKRQLSDAHQQFGEISEWQQLAAEIECERTTALQLGPLAKLPHRHMGAGRAAPAEQKGKEQAVLTPPEGVLPPQPPPSKVDGATWFVLGTTTSVGPAPGPKSQGFPAPSCWPDELLREAEKQLATYTGPIAKVMVRQAAGKTSNPDQLYAVLADGLKSEADRKAFLSWAATRTAAMDQAPRQTAPSVSAKVPAGSGSSEALAPVAVDCAARILAHYLGPIAGVLARRAAQRADSVRTLYFLLAEHLESKSDRSRFLRDAGFPDA